MALAAVMVKFPAWPKEPSFCIPAPIVPVELTLPAVILLSFPESKLPLLVNALVFTVSAPLPAKLYSKAPFVLLSAVFAVMSAT